MFRLKVRKEVTREGKFLQDHAFLGLGLRSRSGIKNGTERREMSTVEREVNVARGASHIPDSFVEHTLQIALCKGRTFEVLVRTDLLGHGQRLLVRYGFHLSCAKAVCGRSIVSQVQLGTDEDDRDIGGMMFDFRIPLRTHTIGQLPLVSHARSDLHSTLHGDERKGNTLALTLSKDGGLTMEKQMRKTSVWG